MSDCMYIDETIQKVTLYTTVPDMAIFCKEYVYNDSHTYWTNMIKLEQDTVTVVCLCNWKPYNSSLRLYIADNGQTEIVRSTRVVQPGHLHVSVYGKQQVPTLRSLSTELLSTYRASTEYMSTYVYMTGDDLYAIKPATLFLSNEYGNHFRSCTQPAHTLNTPPGLGHPQTYVTIPPRRESQSRGIRGRFRSRTFSRR